MNTHRIHRVAKLTGLSRDVIRIWERRFKLVQPTRSANRYRQYSDEDVLLLRYLKQELDRGASIGALAEEGRAALVERAKESAPPAARAATQNHYARLVDELCADLDPLNKTMFERRLNGAVAIIPFEEALHGILIPLQQRVGELWHLGQLNVAVEHYVSKLVLQKIYAVLNHLPLSDTGPMVVVACPPRETHELGALTVAYHCAIRGCRVLYLGGDTPVEELAAMCRDIEPALVLLSVTLAMTEDDRAQLLAALVERVSPLCPVGVGGPGVAALQGTAATGIGSNLYILEDLTALNRLLEKSVLARPVTAG